MSYYLKNEKSIQNGGVDLIQNTAWIINNEIEKMEIFDIANRAR